MPITLPDLMLPRRFAFGWAVALLFTAALPRPAYSSEAADPEFDTKVKPILTEYCYDCHGDGMDKGNVSLDGFKSHAELLEADDLWLRVLRNVRAEVMPPEKKKKPTPEEMKVLEEWIKSKAFGIDAENPDPGRVTLRRLNRVEYRNTIRDLMGIDFNTVEEFPPDDTGYGFDNIGDVLTISPLLLEKYLQAAEKIVQEAVPTVAKVMAQKSLDGRELKREGGGSENVSFYDAAKFNPEFKADHDGEYKITLDLAVRGAFDFDPGRAVAIFKIDGEEKLRQEFGWENYKKHEFEFQENWKAGEHKLTVEFQPLTKPEEKKTSVDFRLNEIRISGPLDSKYWAKTRNYDRFFPREEPPQGEEERRAYAREVLQKFATKAFRRPVDDRTLDRLVAIAEIGYADGKRFEQGVSQAMIAVLASPRFLYRVEQSTDPEKKFAPLDEYALASRLSYFLWSTMPDEELFRLAERGELRANLKAQVERMLKSDRSRQFVNNFTGQWLQVRDVEGIAINERAVFFRDSDLPRRERRRVEPKAELNGELRRAMQEETQEFFNYILKEDRSLLEMIDSDYTFVNERLAKHYGIEGVEGRNTRKVELPEDSPRGGLITQGSVLVVTSNPTRTSPVKRGLFLLDNFLGTPPPPPPPDIPELEVAEDAVEGREPTLREALELHLSSSLCRSCHLRMDPLGLALENFNALGMWREMERGQKIDSTGKLITGEEFSDVRELKRVLKEDRRLDFYRTITEKLMTYALGRGIEYYDMAAVDDIVGRLEKEDGRFSALLMGVIESAPFQKRRNVSIQTASGTQNKPVAARD